MGGLSFQEHLKLVQAFACIPRSKKYPCSKWGTNLPILKGVKPRYFKEFYIGVLQKRKLYESRIRHVFIDDSAKETQSKNYKGKTDRYMINNVS